MSLTGTLQGIRKRFTETADRLRWLAPLVVRLSVGAVFIGAGWGKLQDPGSVTAFFSELGIPWPAFNARFVAANELVCGVAIFLGLGTRLLALPLIGDMAVAILTAKRDDVEGLLTFLALDEFLYVAVLVWLVLVGAGPVSLDALVGRARALAGRVTFGSTRA